jgi:hypothetical protein
MKRVWLAIAMIALMAVLSSVGCSAGAGNASPAQNVQSGSPQQPPQNPSGGQPGPGVNQPRGFAGPGASGTVISVSGNTIQLTGQDGSAVAVKVDDKTAIQKNVTGTMADIQVGTRLMVIGEQSSGTTTARTIQIMPAAESAPQAPPGQAAGQPGQGGNPPSQGSGQPGPAGGQPGTFGGPGLGGTVKSVSGNTIQLTGFDGSTVTVKVDDKTTIQKTAAATLSDIRANLQITVIGDASGGTITARMIRIGTDGK